MPAHCVHNAHLYYLLLEEVTVEQTLQRLSKRGVSAVSHDVPLHSSRAGLRYGRAVGDLPNTVWAGDRLIRLPLWFGMDEETIARVVDAVHAVLDPRVATRATA